MARGVRARWEAELGGVPNILKDSSDSLEATNGAIGRYERGSWPGTRTLLGAKGLATIGARNSKKLLGALQASGGDTTLKASGPPTCLSVCGSSNSPIGHMTCSSLEDVASGQERRGFPLGSEKRDSSGHDCPKRSTHDTAQQVGCFLRAKKMRPKSTAGLASAHQAIALSLSIEEEKLRQLAQDGPM